MILRINVSWFSQPQPAWKWNSVPVLSPSIFFSFPILSLTKKWDKPLKCFSSFSWTGPECLYLFVEHFRKVPRLWSNVRYTKLLLFIRQTHELLLWLAWHNWSWFLLETIFCFVTQSILVYTRGKRTHAYEAKMIITRIPKKQRH